jgi:hypothetical protein
MSAMDFTATLFEPDPSLGFGKGPLISLPIEVSKKLPTRGMTLIEGNIGGINFKAVVEPNGEGSHWFKVNRDLIKNAKIKTGDSVQILVEPSKDWPEPKIPKDFQMALENNTLARDTFFDITPMARWDWIRWITSAKLEETRIRRVEVACSKLSSGMRRPCCFDRNQRTLTES